jgi:hypothetical protein
MAGAEKLSIKSKGGKREGAGRKKGIPNKLSTTVKDNIISVFDGIGGIKTMQAWAKKNPSHFYNLYAKLLPLQVTGDPENPLQIQIIRFADAAKPD